MDICALQETRRDGFMSFKTENYEVFYFGECSGKGGFGIAVHKRFLHLISSTRGISGLDGRLMTMDILLHDNHHHVTFLCSYAPTSTAPARIRDKFYSHLNKLVTSNSWLLGDFNSRVGRRPIDTTSGVEPSNTVGPWSLKNDITQNSNGTLLLNIASELYLRHVPSHFQLRDSKRWTWRHPRYHTRAVLDHVFVPSTHIRFFARCFFPSDIAIFTDYRPVICELNFRPLISPKSSSLSPSLNVRALSQTDIKEAFQIDIESSLGDMNPEDVPSEQIAASIRSVTVAAAQKVIPAKRKSKYPQEFSPATITLMNRKRRLWTFLQKSGRRVTRPFHSV